jgi:Family of unknown function (DUF6502)
MDVQSVLPKALNRAVRRLLTPLFRLLLRQGMSFTAFEELAKRVYVEIALREFGIPGKKPSISRASILSGLTRKDVQRLLAEPLESLDDGGGERHNRAARVLTAWTQDPDFLDANGEPRVLPPQEGDKSFAALVRRHSGDMPVRAVLDELVRVGAVRRGDDGNIELLTRAFLPRRSAVDKLALLGTDVGDLVTTIDHNIQFGDTDPRFQRKVMYRNMLASDVPEFRQLSSAQAMAVLQKLDRWLAERAEAAAAPEFEGKPRVRLGLGIYYFEDHLDEAPSGKDE